MSNQRQGEGGSSAVMLFIVGLMMAFLMVLIWYKNHTRISYWGLFFSWKQLGALDFSMFPKIAALRNEISTMAANPKDISFGQLVSVLNTAGYIFVIIPITITCLIIYGSLKHRSEKVRRVITVKNLPYIMAKHSPAVIPVLMYGDLMNTDVPGQESRMHPEEFADKHQLIDPVTKKLDEVKTSKLFEQQLGRRISSLEELNVYEKALFAVFASRVFDTAENAKKAPSMLDTLNRSCFTGQWKGEAGYPDFTLLDKEVKYYLALPAAQELVASFYYPSTLLYMMHTGALSRGKLPSSNFRWLKGIDRKLWFTLNAVGRRTPCIESIVQIQNYRWQKLAFDNGCILDEPNIQDSVDSFKQYLQKEGKVSKRDENSSTSEHSDNKVLNKDELNEGV